MADELTGLDVLAIAERMERNASGFYRRAAGLYDDPELSKLFSELAQWEKRHMEVFAEMKQRLSEGMCEIGQYGAERDSAPVARVPAAVFADRVDPSGELTGREAKADVLRLAIEKEKEAIAYYTGLREFVLAAEDVGALEEILEEEARHVRILMQSLGQIV
jgi:rubrerythrin